ncbi:MAG: DUF1538 domain-containing protein [Eubacteriales bacterium]|nr:DUF1538 domain-containing protein [Eubacteriales bacterium]
MTVLKEKFQEVLASVLPVTLFVLVLQLLFRPLDGMQCGRFLFAAGLVLVGLTIFLLGIDTSIAPIGSSLSRSLARTGKLFIVLPAALALGFLINIAEPDLMILARNIDDLTQGGLGYTQLMLAVSTGLGFMVMLGFWRIFKQIKLRYLFVSAYLVVLVLALLSPSEYLAMAFDACGATTGAITTPFLLALSTGLAAMARSSSRDGSETFGMVGLASSGAVIAVLFLGTLSGQGSLQGELLLSESGSFFFDPFKAVTGPMFRQAAMAIMPLTVIFLLINGFTKETRIREYGRIFVGLIYCILGLAIFTIGAEGGFMQTAQLLSMHIMRSYPTWLMVVLGFFLGMTTVLAEPAVHVLTKQIQEQTSGAISHKLVMIFLSLGVAIAVAISILRIIIPGLQLWYILLPLYIIAIALSFINDELFTGIAFDSGGVVSGPMTATFVLTFAQGAAYALDPTLVVQKGYGVIALVCTSPLVSLQILGLIYKVKARKQNKKEVSRVNS